MAAGFNPKDNRENDLIGNILSDDNGQDFFNIRLAMGRSISAPPPGLVETLTSSTPDINQNGPVDKTATREYYYYYHSIKPHDPRLPTPKWKPAFYDHEMANLQGAIMEGNSESGGTNPDESSVDDLGSHFEQSISLGSTKETSQKGFGDDSKGYLDDNRPMMQMQQGQHRGQGQQHGHDQQYRQNQNNYDRRSNNQHNNDHSRQYGYNQHRPNNQNFNHQMNQNGHNQGQFFPPQQQMGNFYGGNYMNPQMQQPQQFYGMNSFQPQPFPYQDPNMNMNGMGKFPPNYQYMQGGNGQMPMNPMYMNQNPYMNNYYPMGMQQPTPNGYPNAYPQNNNNNNFQNNNNFGNKGQKPINKPKLDLKQVLENLLENCRDQNGSRLIQQHLEKVSDEEKEEMFQQILPEALALMTDVFGNYVIQKFLELGTQDHKHALFEVTHNSIPQLSQDTYGCRVVQKILEQFRNVPSVQDAVLEEINRNIVSLVEDQNGNHVIQKCFELVPINKLQFIISEVKNKVDRLAVHPYGCRVIQKILETASEEQSAPMLAKLMGNAIACCQCQHGNYIMQHVLEKGPQAEKRQLLEVLKKNFIKLSMNKFASNVTEKSAIHGTPDFRHDVIDVLVTSYYDNKIGLVALMTHPYGNYVVQRLFECSDDKFKRKVYDRVSQENIEEIKKNSYGRHVMTFVEKWMENQRH